MTHVSNDTNAVKSRTGEQAAVKFLQSAGFKNIKRREKGDPIGFDFKAEKDGKTVKIEVKSTGSENEIPDSMGNEFDLANPREPKLVADYLLVVRLREESGSPGTYKAYGAHLLTQEVVNRYKHKLKLSVVLSRELKNKLKHAPEYWLNWPK